MPILGDSFQKLAYHGKAAERQSKHISLPVSGLEQLLSAGRQTPHFPLGAKKGKQWEVIITYHSFALQDGRVESASELKEGVLRHREGGCCGKHAF